MVVVSQDFLRRARQQCEGKQREDNRSRGIWGEQGRPQYGILSCPGSEQPVAMMTLTADGERPHVIYGPV